MLREVDSLRTRGVKGGEFNKAAFEKLQEHVGKVNSPNAAMQAAALRADTVGHHILRLAYCNTDEKRKWFLAQEGSLFRARFEMLTPEQRSEFCVREKLRFVEASREEYTQFETQLEDLWHMNAGRRRKVEAEDEGEAGGAGAGAAKRQSDYKAASVRFFKVRFTDSVELLRSHQGALRACVRAPWARARTAPARSRTVPAASPVCEPVCHTHADMQASCTAAGCSSRATT